MSFDSLLFIACNSLCSYTLLASPVLSFPSFSSVLFPKHILLHRYKYENDTIVEASSTDIGSPLQYHLYSNGKLGGDAPSRGTENQLLERQVFHSSAAL